jgi:uncharacterized protein GlcG (DUF336 family)
MIAPMPDPTIGTESDAAGGGPNAREVQADAGEIPWAVVHALIGSILGAAEGRGVRVAVALTDRWGRELAFQRQPGTVMASSAVAIGKAFTACTFDAPVHELVKTISRRDQEELGRVNSGLIFAGGGFPIRSAGSLLGGIGVSGAASAEEDAELALDALRSLGFDDDFGGTR